MKKVVLFTIAMMLVAFSANAQKKFTYGIKGGLNVANISNLDVSNGRDGFVMADPVPSFHIGVFTEWKLAGFFAVAPELVYSSQGVKIWVYTSLGPISSIDISSKLNLSYINIPVMAKLYPFKWLSIDMGPQVGLLLAAKTRSETRTTYEGVKSVENETFDSKDAVNSFDFSLAGGLTFNFSKHIFLQARYNIGLTEVFKGESNLNDKKHNNRVIQFGLGCRF